MRVMPGSRMTEADARTLRHAMRMAGPNVRRALRPLAPDSEGEVRGLRWRLRPSDNFTEFVMWMSGEVAEPRSLDALLDLVRGRRAHVLDIGANCGAFCLPLAAAAGPGSAVHAFEPNPPMADRLAVNMALNDSAGPVRLHRVALGAERGDGALTIDEDNLGHATLRGGEDDGRLTVAVRPLSDYLDREDAEVSVLKIDVEGMEDDVLGAMLVDEAAPLPDAILIETEHADEWPRDLRGLIEARGYEERLKAEGNTFYVRATGAGIRARRG
jgi:FkbM family methyltransferase